MPKETKETMPFTKDAYHEMLQRMLATGSQTTPSPVTNPVIERLKQAAAGYKPLGKK